jgi:hypothetical protein
VHLGFSQLKTPHRGVSTIGLAFLSDCRGRTRVFARRAGGLTSPSAEEVPTSPCGPARGKRVQTRLRSYLAAAYSAEVAFGYEGRAGVSPLFPGRFANRPYPSDRQECLSEG